MLSVEGLMNIKVFLAYGACPLLSSRVIVASGGKKDGTMRWGIKHRAQKARLPAGRSCTSQPSGHAQESRIDPETGPVILTI
jgi:hypothetical protein